LPWQCLYEHGSPVDDVLRSARARRRLAPQRCDRAPGVSRCRALQTAFWDLWQPMRAGGVRRGLPAPRYFLYGAARCLRAAAVSCANTHLHLALLLMSCGVCASRWLACRGSLAVPAMRAAPCMSTYKCRRECG